MADVRVLVPLDGGLDSYSNPHRLTPGTFTAATGVALNQNGYAYPGPAYSLSSTFSVPSGTTSINHGLGAYSARTQGNADGLVTWQSVSDAQAGVPGPTNLISTLITATDGTIPGPLPFRQQQCRLSGAQSLPGYIMTGPPQAVASEYYRFYVWEALMPGSGPVLNMVIQEIATGVTSAVYTLYNNDGFLEWTLSTIAGANLIILQPDAKWTIAANQSSFSVDITGKTLTASGSLSCPSGGFPRELRLNPSTVSTTGTGNPVLGASCPTGNVQVVVWADGSGNILISQAGTAFANPLTVLTGMTATAPFTVIYDGTSGNWLVASMSGATICFAQVSPALAIVAGTSGNTAPPGIFGTPTQLGACLNQNAYVFIVEQKMSATALSGTLNSTVTNIVLSAVNGGSTTLTAWGGLALAGRPFSWTWANGKTDILFPTRTGWRHADGAWGAPTAPGAPPAYPTGYIYNVAGKVVARFGDGDVGTDSLWPEFASANYAAPSLPGLPEACLATLTSGQQVLSWPFPQWNSVQAYSTSIQDYGAAYGTQCGCSMVALSAPTAAEPPAAMVQFGSTLVIPGSIVMNYDGALATEAGFFHPAPTPVVTLAANGSLPVGAQYFYRTVLYFTDAAGNVHYSQPSNPVVTPALTSGNQQISITVPVVGNQTYKNLNSAFGVKIYRSINQQVSSANVPALRWYEISNLTIGNSGTTQTDNTPDTVLENYGTIYTQNMAAGAAVGTTAPPAFDCITVWNNCLWGISNRNGPELWFSWPLSNATFNREGPAWSQYNRVPLPAEIGQPKAIVGMDSNLIILGTKADYAINGPGLPRALAYTDDTGAYQAPSVLPTPGGIKVLNGVTKLPNGILFQGQQGFTLLDRSLQYEFAGKAVNNLAQANLYLPGVYVPSIQAVILYSSSNAGADLVYFYGTRQWSQCEHPPSTPGGTTAAGPIVASAKAEVGNTATIYLLPSTGTYVATVQPYSGYMSFRTSWIEMTAYSNQLGAGVSSSQLTLAGYGALREVQVIGDIPGQAKEAYTLTLTTEYDYEGNTSQPNDVQTITSGGKTPNQDFQWRFGFSSVNARRVRFTVTFNAGQMALSSLGNNPAVLLSGIEVMYTVDSGLSRLGAGNSTNIA